jgi:hypothetical protein
MSAERFTVHAPELVKARVDVKPPPKNDPGAKTRS